MRHERSMNVMVWVALGLLLALLTIGALVARVDALQPPTTVLYFPVVLKDSMDVLPCEDNPICWNWLAEENDGS